MLDIEAKERELREWRNKKLPDIVMPPAPVYAPQAAAPIAAPAAAPIAAQAVEKAVADAKLDAARE